MADATQKPHEKNPPPPRGVAVPLPHEVDVPTEPPQPALARRGARR